MSIFPSNPSVNDEFSGYRWNGEVWEVIGVDLARDYALESDFTSHTSASTTVHGIDNVATLAHLSDVDSASAAAVSSANSYADTAASNAAAGIVDSAPDALNTLNELAAALNDDANFATTVTNSLSTKLDSSSASTTYATITTVNTKQDKSSAFVVVDHGTDANYARPTGVGAVYWTGSVQPNNATAADLWLEP